MSELAIFMGVIPYWFLPLLPRKTIAFLTQFARMRGALPEKLPHAGAGRLAGEAGFGHAATERERLRGRAIPSEKVAQERMESVKSTIHRR